MSMPPMRLRPPEWDLLLSAAQKNRPDQIRTLITEHGVDPSHANTVGQTALHIAALWGHVEAAAVLLDAGADVSAQNKMTGATPLHMAVQTVKADGPRRGAVIDWLLRYGANVSQADFYNNLPLDYLRDDDVGNDPLLAKLQPKAPDLFSAIEERDVEKVRQRLAESGGSSLNGMSFRGQTVVTRTVQDLLQIVDGEDEDDDDDQQNQQQQIENANKLVAILKAFLQAGADSNAVAKTGDEIDANDPPLYQICSAMRIRAPNASKTETETEAEAEAASSSCWKWNALQEAAMDLSELGNAEVTAETRQLLHDAARRNQVSMMRFLVDGLRVDPNAAGRQGMTALQFASRSGQLEAVQYLLRQPRIDVRKTDDRGQTALDAARVNGKERVAQLLHDHMDAENA